MPTDRLIVAWPTHDREIDDNLAETHRTYASLDCRQGPVVTDELMAGMAGVAILPHCVRIQIPPDAEALVRDAPAEALDWRRRVRCGMRWAIAAGYAVSAFYVDEDSGHGYYLMTRTTRHSPGNGAPAPVVGGRQ
jgi:predicted GNAT superfamily acetyltransferase